MSRTYLIATLLLALLSGCSSSTPPKAADPQPSPKPAMDPVSTPAPTPVASATPSPSPTASPKPVQKKQAKAEKEQAGSSMDRFAKCLAEIEGQASFRIAAE